MSERSPRQSGLSPAPLPLALLLVFATVVVLGVIYLLTIGLTAPVGVGTGALAKSNEPQNNPGANRNAIARATATLVESEQAPNYDLTPTRVLPVPTDAPTPFGAVRPTELPPPTAIAYTPGPTASLEQLVPLEEWKEYVNEQQGFTIKYPPNWYLNAGPTGQTTQIFSYDFNDPAFTGYKGSPRNITKIEIYARRGQLSAMDQLQGNETIREWVYRTGRISEGDQVIQEEEITVDGLPALRQLVAFEYGGLMEAVYIKRPNDVILVGQPYREDWTVPNQVFDLLVQSFRIQK